ncbi:MAG TPA: nickel-dependent lactate racemase [Candidatus Alectryocaccobium stercorigallinarum]|nr:nickel-dependent lactate racemase [Candidatus Alectryocaccobium stercorigallinarum]
MKIEFGYGNGVQTVDVPEKNLIDILVSNPMEHKRRGKDAVDHALANPIGSPKLGELVNKDQKIVIITSDISRPLPSYDVVPSVLDELYAAGVPKENITIVFGLGSHRKQTEEEMKHLVGERAYSEVKCMDSTPGDCVHLGTTSGGTPVDITRAVAEADFRIALGNVEFHYFAGYSGGAKALMPGVSTPAAIQANHSKMVSKDACAGKLEGNPIREDIEEAGRICPIHFIVNAVLDEHKHIVYAVAGDCVKAHRDACAYLDKMYRKAIPEKADIVLVSQGGAPKDANLYQTQKALDNAKHAVKDGGTIIVIGACNEGLGSKKFEDWLVNAPTAHSLVERIAKDFQLGGHKAAAIAMILEYANIDLVSEMDDDFVRSIFMNPQHSAQEAFDQAMAKYGPDARVLAMPFGGATLPIYTGK